MRFCRRDRRLRLVARGNSCLSASWVSILVEVFICVALPRLRIYLSASSTFRVMSIT
jgi:hypothetical protein